MNSLVDSFKEKEAEQDARITYLTEQNKYNVLLSVLYVAVVISFIVFILMIPDIPFHVFCLDVVLLIVWFILLYYRWQEYMKYDSLLSVSEGKKASVNENKVEYVSVWFILFYMLKWIVVVVGGILFICGLIYMTFFYHPSFGSVPNVSN